MGRTELQLDRLARDRQLFAVSQQNAEDPDKDRNGGSSAMHASLLRRIGILEFLLNGDRGKLHESLCGAAKIAMRLFERHDRGDGVDDSFVSMLAYKELFNVLAIGDIELARSLARHMGGRDELERQHDHPFDRAIGYCLKAFVLGNRAEMKQRLVEFANECDEKDNKDFRGYVQVFEAILEGNVAKAKAGFVELLKGHRRQCKGNGVFRFTLDQDLCVWGLGMANLARHYGLNVHIDDPLIPSELLI
jgi:hypothetical protein